MCIHRTRYAFRIPFLRQVILDNNVLKYVTLRGIYKRTRFPTASSTQNMIYFRWMDIVYPKNK
jgi:hypothetical protein